MLSIYILRQLATRWCPPAARSQYFTRNPACEWGPAHELGHALLSEPRERSLASYGLCDSIYGCWCYSERCLVIELAAMIISARLHLAARRPDLIQTEIRATEDYDHIDHPRYRKRAARLLAEHRLTRIPRTHPGLVRLLERRLAQ